MQEQRKEFEELSILEEYKMELKDRVKYLKDMEKKLEQGIYYVEHQVIPRLAADKDILANIKKDLIKAEAELAKPEDSEASSDEEVINQEAQEDKV